MASSTALEALTAELLGDVGVLHDEVKALSRTLPQLTDEAVAKLSELIGQLVLAAETLRNDQAATIQLHQDRAVAALEMKAKEFICRYADEIGKAVLAAARDGLQVPTHETMAEIRGACSRVEAATVMLHRVTEKATKPQSPNAALVSLAIVFGIVIGIAVAGHVGFLPH